MADIIDIETHKDAALARAVEILSSGEPIAMPTETVYGLAADATNPDAIARIYEVKGRPRFNPLIAHVADLAMAERHAHFDSLSRKLAEAFWPGPLTLVLPLKADSDIHDLCTAGLPTVGLRCPRGFASELIASYGKPLAAPSANRSGRISPTSAAHVADDLGDRIKLVLDGGSAAVGVESTIVKIEGGEAKLLRPGGLDAAEIEAVLGVQLIRADHGAAIEAPGMLASHYAPDVGVRLDVDCVRPGEALINFAGQDIAGRDMAVEELDLSPRGDLREAAANLFAMMKQADALAPAAIVFAPIPMDGLGEAINDRLSRAAAPKS
ncbi:L-threonylcarbamoyladenylate synthase [Rhizobium sp. SG_E_25_P2]|uniref:L-threonylcarbamoyladenylate synthase n=1 Tax=Rhizobium sp. SG_E_25_P2 TaxID=2879942 RepID=UPI0024744469|nr:L-threonylcarbamoyladenylate synthase [Rhizobium sp. SG_E_25_P2]MDH6266555.1 L-threonylcarbamoyladenylate synthase [Rhizobium sp. SG_E_25_P2]